MRGGGVRGGREERGVIGRSKRESEVGSVNESGGGREYELLWLRFETLRGAEVTKG